MILFQHTRKSYFSQLFSAPTEQSTLTDTYLNQFIEIQPFYCDLFPTMKCGNKRTISSQKCNLTPSSQHTTVMIQPRVWFRSYIFICLRQKKPQKYIILSYIFSLHLTSPARKENQNAQKQRKRRGEKPHQPQTIYTVSGFTYTLTGNFEFSSFM